MALDFLHHVRVESARFAEVLVDDVEPTAEVPSCPGWTAVDLLWHLGEVQYFWARIVADKVADPDELAEPERPEGWSATADFLTAASSALVSALERTPDDTHVWTWFTADQTAGFVRRRQAHEALIHRVDAELTAGITPQIEPALAADGAIEVLDWMFSGVPAWAERVVEGTVGAVNITDTGESRLVRLGRWSGTSPNSGVTYTDEASITVVESGEPTFEVGGAAADLDLWLWNRPTQGEITLVGDSSEFERIIAEGVQ